MHKIKITKKQWKQHWKNNLRKIISDLYNWYGIEVVDLKPIRSCLKRVKYYEIHIEVYTTSVGYHPSLQQVYVSLTWMGLL